ncbi:MAG: hypothetical protein EOM80_12675 [Erysipelotrichia bacterium]|nr:hypothetical protein [Erysipelotrichia bacterium]
MNDNLFLFNDFIIELSENESPGHLDQIEIFYEDTEKLFDSLTDVITGSQLAMTYASVRQKGKILNVAGEPEGYLLQWPDNRCGLSSIVRSESAGMHNSVIAVFPFVNEGVRFFGRLRETRLFANRLEAQLVVDFGEEEELALTFYDVHYLSNRSIYRKNGRYDFVLRGLAYFIENSASVNCGESVEGALFPREDLGFDHYEIQGLIKKIEIIDAELYGQKAQKIWQIRLAFAVFPSGEDVELDIFVSEKVMKKSCALKTGENIQAVIWLQGHLWGVSEE